MILKRVFFLSKDMSERTQTDVGHVNYRRPLLPALSDEPTISKRIRTSPPLVSFHEKDPPLARSLIHSLVRPLVRSFARPRGMPIIDNELAQFKFRIYREIYIFFEEGNACVVSIVVIHKSDLHV